jgi:tetratricopeptide (TPR) repeat protein
MECKRALPAFFVLFVLSTCLKAEPPENLENIAASQSLAWLEENVLHCLGTGDQQEAEALLEDELERKPDLARMVSLLDSHHLADAKKMFEDRPNWYRDQQRLLFLHAACLRSRFEKEDAFRVFRAVCRIDSKTPAGRCAYHVLALDVRAAAVLGVKYVDGQFAELERLADANPEDVVIRWMLAVECRTWNRNELGAKQYRIILEKWTPGPVLVHQTYANLLDELKRHDEALAERRIAVEMEPAGWSYDGMANTLHYLGRFLEAEQAHTKAAELNPSSARHLLNWAATLHDEGKQDEAIEKCRRALVLDARSVPARWIWADCLESQNKKAEALKELLELSEIYPLHARLNSRIADLKMQLGE